MPAATATELTRIQRAGRNLDRALTAVAAGALAFSTVNVALLAIAHGVPAWIAWLLEPLVGIALWAVLSSDAVLSRYGASAGVWAWLLRAFTGGVTLTLNVWSSVFTTGAGGVLRLDPDPAGILLHAIAPVLLILLAEAAPRYRAEFARIETRLRSAPARPAAPAPRSPGRGPAAPGPGEPAEALSAHLWYGTPPAGTAGRSGPQAPEGPAAGPDPGATPPPAAAAATAPAPRPPHGPDPAAHNPSTGPAPPAPPDAAPGPDPTRLSRKKKRKHRRDRNDARARRILADHPHITGAELARRLGVQTRSGQRILNRITAPAPEPAAATTLPAPREEPAP
ncbi:hypothetical protein CLV63_1129 [Murinocardiopsis flavida]|uniref:DUF2637 domain-containing protein n=1 Tax=Murinocardiopsis flavida TaxID=645275 RepID=A0A2P8DFY8_9ACTN|nr:hypothetical protein [Murinocardiopsis flavida]PSK96127.1 hypothetical protein CLV63_1129 [Murinocardiopsis flavida]